MSSQDHITCFSFLAMQKHHKYQMNSWKMTHGLCHFQHIVLYHYTHSVKDIFGDLIQTLVEFSSKEIIFGVQPCRDNMLYLLRLTDEMFMSKIENLVLFPSIGYEMSLDSFNIKSLHCTSVVHEIL